LRKIRKAYCPGVLFLVCAGLLVSANTSQALAGPFPRWPEPAWYNQFSTPAPATKPEGITPVVQPPAPAQQPAPAPSITMSTAAEEELLNLTNQERSSRGLKHLVIDPAATQVARMKSQDMITHNYFGHLSPAYGKVSDMLNQAGISFYIAGENLARASDVATAHFMMMDSSVHRSAILNPRYAYVGIGVLSTGTGVMVTEIFFNNQ